MKSGIISRVSVYITAFCLTAGMFGCGQYSQPNANDTAYEEDDNYTDEDEYYDEDDSYDEESSDDDDSDTAGDLESDYIGITFHLPEKYTSVSGMLDYYDMYMDLDDGIFYAEMDYTGLPRDEIDKMNDEGMDYDDWDEYSGHTVPVFVITAITGNRSAAEMLEVINNEFGEDITEDDLTLITKVDDCSFYECESLYTDNYYNLDDDYQVEYYDLFSLKDDLLKNATYTRPVTSSDETAGTKVSFTTTDLNGNTVNSDDIFSRHEITMVNLWATWCGYCVDELPELEALNNSLAAKDCAVIGLCGDADNPDDLGLALDLIEENGVTYLNLCPFDGWPDIFDNEDIWPVSFFVDRNSNMVSTPVFGAEIAEYEKHIDAALSGNTGLSSEQKNSDANSDGLYRITVVDDDLEPVEGAMVQYCTDDLCKTAVTDSDGVITFNDPPGVYEVHVPRVPDGYKENTNTYRTEDYYSDMVIEIEKE